jgi:protoporphyrinogen IX oxidase
MYLWIKVLHLAAIISWMAGILYLYRILVNMRDHATGIPEVHNVLYGMGLRLYRYITMPAMGASYIAGIILIAMQPLIMRQGFFHAKLLFVLILTASTVAAGKMLKKSASSANYLPTSKRLRFLNEIPTVLMLLILIMIIVRPWSGQ